MFQRTNTWPGHNQVADEAILHQSNMLSSKTKFPKIGKRFLNMLWNKTLLHLIIGALTSVLMAISLTSLMHYIKYIYVRHLTDGPYSLLEGNISLVFTKKTKPDKSKEDDREQQLSDLSYNTPFLTTWIVTAWIGLIFPIYALIYLACFQDKNIMRNLIQDTIRSIYGKGISTLRFVMYCLFFCLLWVISNYVYIRSLRVLRATDILSLYVTQVKFVYLLSWVILHDQFVGVRIVATIICDTGIALLAYMDGVVHTRTLLAVAVSAAGAAGAAVHKVLWKKLLGEGAYNQTAVLFTIISLCSTVFLWPVVTVLHLTSIEIIQWNNLPWTSLLMIGFLTLIVTIINNFGSIVTQETFISLGMAFSIPLSAAIEQYFLKQSLLNNMELFGLTLIACGTTLVLVPANWTDYITMCLRCLILRKP